MKAETEGYFHAHCGVILGTMPNGKGWNVNHTKSSLVLLGAIALLGAAGAFAQDVPFGAPPEPGQGGPGMRDEGGPRPLLGKITAVHEGSLEITRPEGQVVIVKITDKTEFRKDRQPAKVGDFKVGDIVMVRGDENPDHSVTAKTIGSRTGGMMYSGPTGGAGGRAGGGQMGTLGKDFVVGEVKAIDPPRLTVLRTDNVTQTLELNEDTSLRRGRESITMADIQVGDHVMARGALQNEVFVPKGVMVMNAEQWKRLQEFAGPGNDAKPAAPPAGAPKSQEHPN
jgi:uncharacterized protein DUF5666